MNRTDGDLEKIRLAVNGITAHLLAWIEKGQSSQLIQMTKKRYEENSEGGL